jgi:hypothetical protein
VILGGTEHDIIGVFGEGGDNQIDGGPGNDQIILVDSCGAGVGFPTTTATVSGGPGYDCIDSGSNATNVNGGNEKDICIGGVGPSITTNCEATTGSCPAAAVLSSILVDPDGTPVPQPCGFRP